MSQKMIVTNETILIDFRLIFKAIKENKGNWKKAEKEMEALFETLSEEVK